MTEPTFRNARPVLVGLGMMLVAFNMRPALTSVGPLLDFIRAETGLTAAGAAFLTTLPVLCLGLACVLGPVVVRRTGAERGVLAAILVIALGSALLLGKATETQATRTSLLDCIALSGANGSRVVVQGHYTLTGRREWSRACRRRDCLARSDVVGYFRVGGEVGRDGRLLRSLQCVLVVR